MKLRAYWMLLAVALPLVSLQTSCGQTSPQEISDAGTLRLRLGGVSPAGTLYRLRDAELEITGPTSVTLHTEEDPDAEFLLHDLPAGAYEILLEDGWFLERQAQDGSFVPVEALLVSANPAPFEIVTQDTTYVTLTFLAGGEIIDLGDGTLDVSIWVDELSCGELQSIATLPSLVEGIQRIDSDPHALLVATEGASIWRIELDHAGQATDVSFQQSLDLVQSTNYAFFETSDGTLLTGALDGPPYYSTDHGHSFQPATNGDYPPDATYVYAELNGQVYAGTGVGENIGPYPAAVYRYNGGGSWSHVFSFLPPHNIVRSMAVHQGQLFVGANIQGDDDYYSFGCDYQEVGSVVYVSSDGVSFTPTKSWSCTGQALASAGDQLWALIAYDTIDGYVREWDSASQKWGKQIHHEFYPMTLAQHRFLGSGGAFYAAALQRSVDDGGIYRTEDGTSWALVADHHNMLFDVLTVESGTFGHTLYAADGDTIYSFNLCD